MLRGLQDRRTRAQLSLDRRRGPERPLAIAAACWSFPIPSQTFVYQEIQAFEWAGLDYRMFCCETTGKDGLPAAFEDLWNRRVVLKSDWELNQRDYDHFVRTRPDRVQSLLTRLGEATGLMPEALLRESIVMMGFTFARHAELAGAAYLHTYFFYDQSFMALMAAWLLGLPRGITAYADHMLNDYQFKCVPLQIELADIVVATSQRIRDELNALSHGRFDDKILVKPNGIDTSRFPYRTAADRLATNGIPELISVSRIEPKKGLIYLVDAIGMLAARGVPVRLNLVGGVDTHTPTSGEYYRELTARIDELGLNDQVILHGSKQQHEFAPLLARSRVFVAPYVEVSSGDKDGIPTAVLEAMSTGLPIVATDAGSILEAITDSVEGIAVPQRDSERLANAIERLLTDQPAYARMSDSARSRAVAQFDARVTERRLHERILARLESETR
jgi:glycosyltransferase involved in cell wall biosynthesis